MSETSIQISTRLKHMSDDGKTYGVGPVPAPGQFFVRLRLKNTTHMLTDWIEEIEAQAIAGAINKRLEKARRQAA
ncbi:hypothetical protein [Labrenzia sp. VG12]|uniref:hypothetical protein n=1 Tax=Labrenzia sp. VG12 TaxID=2021862 RepID=UPI0012FD93AF|nr:hypothetical protein [Labrenzia sp. VG12]